MPSTFQRTGSAVYYLGFHVATLNENAPATVLDAAENLIDCCDPGQVSREEHAEALKEIEDDLGGQIKDLETELAATKRERDDLETECDELKARISELTGKPYEAVPKFDAWLASKIGTRHWLVAARLGSRMKAKGYTRAIPQAEFSKLQAEYQRTFSNVQ